ncbi:hypothetical protein AAE478_004299 [Parahypoxylon ruwenzoriense]
MSLSPADSQSSGPNGEDQTSPPPPALAGMAGTGTGTTQQQQPQPPKRTRVLLSCAPCRNSKLKCDRATPCGQCLRKGKPDACLYAPRPKKHQRPAKSVAARLKRLEGMVREIIDTDGPGKPESPDRCISEEPKASGLVVQGQKATSYVGGTHFMAILEDIEDLKSYFEDPSEDEEGDEAHDPYENTGPSELLMFSRGVPRNKEELLSILPEMAVANRLMNRYFNSNSPSQHTIHVPTFLKEYNEFCQNPSSAPLHWIALLYMILALGVFFSMFQAPHELENDSTVPPMDRFRQFRGAAGWALIWGKYSQPGPHTLQAFVLYVEGDFVTNRENRMNSYLLSSVLIRLMLKMGLHRDPSRLPNITPYDGEMRKRLWNIAIQIDLLVSFSLGLPCMMHGIETDTALPTHLMDSDFDQDTKELPPPRPSSDYTSLTYPINKAAIARAFSQVVRQAHAITPPTYAEVMKVDAQLEEAWESVPGFMKTKSMEESVMDPGILVTQRHGLASLYQKSRCVLHRRYLVEAVAKKEYDYSRRACLNAALALLDYQDTICEACKPGGILSPSGWFVAALTVSDFLLAGMVVALVLQNDKYWKVGGDYNWMVRGPPLPSRGELLQRLKRSHYLWRYMKGNISESKKAEEVVRTMLCRIQAQLGMETTEYETPDTNANSGGGMASIKNLTIDGSGPSVASSSSEPPAESFADFGAIGPNATGAADSAGQIGSDTPWMTPNGYDWNYFDTMANGPDIMQPTQQISQDSWLDGKAIDDFSDFLVSNSWSFAPL